jgi:hypothetical protein
MSPARDAHVDDIGSFWTDWSEATRPILTSGILTAGRENEVGELRKWLSEPPSVLSLRADTREEAVAFFAAVLHQLPPEERLPYFSRAVVIKEGSAWNNLCTSQLALLLVPTFNVKDLVTRATRGGHHVLIPLGRDDSAFPTTLDLPRLHVRHAREALLGMGLAEERAQELGVLARRSLMALRRKIAVSPEVQQPAWAQPARARGILPALLAGCWDDTKDGDRDVIAHLAHLSYDEVSTVLVQWANEPDPPVRRVGDTWLLASKEDAWALLARYLTRDDLERFEAVVLDVLGEIDPGLELPADQRWMAEVMGKGRTYSKGIRDGLADTVTLMGARSETTRWADARSGQERAGRIVRQLLTQANNDWRLWVSLSSQVQYLAEAAPDEFLTAAEAGLSGERPVLVNLFEDTEKHMSALFSHSSHTNLLWALEILAWHPDYLSRAALLLAILARLGPGGRLSKRPGDSLRTIFLCWHPQTTASLDQRLQVLDVLRNREPSVAWGLMSRLLPEFMSSVDSTAMPRWRDWAIDSQRTVTYGELWTAEHETVGRMLTDVGHDGDRWTDLIEHLDDVGKEQHDAIVERLLSIDTAMLPSTDRLAIWSALRALIWRHREFSGATWALPVELVDRLQRVHARFEPDDPIDKYGWLFSNRPELVGPFGRDWQAQDRALAAARQEAVRVVYEHGGLPLLLALAANVEQPGEVGFAVGSSALLAAEEDTLLGQNLGTALAPHSILVRGFVQGRLQARDWGWAEDKITGVVTQWSPEQQAEFFTDLPFEGHTWDLLQMMSSDAQRGYWSRVRPWRVGASDCDRAVRKLLEHNRPHIALDCLTLHLQNKKDQDSARLIAETLEQAVRAVPERSEDWQPLAHYAGELLEALEVTGEIEESRIAALEFALLPFLKRERRGPGILHRELSRNPAFFIEVLSLVYGAENEERRELSQADAGRAQLAHDLLHSWRRVPGTEDDGSINAVVLKEWINQARQAAHVCKRGKVGDITIGRVLSSAPKDPDGSWPTVPVRDVIEEMHNEELDQGFILGVYNSRGGWTKAFAEGGGQERQLAELYRGYATTIREQWPQTAALLRRIAGLYSSEARQSDIEAELEEDLWQ